MKIATALSFLIALAAAPAPAQTQPAASGLRNPAEVAAEYTYAHSNAPPSGCGCFPLNGGSVSLEQPFGAGRYAFVFDTTIVTGSKIGAANYAVTLDTFTAGARYRPFPKAKWDPFGEVLMGVGHAGGSLVSGQTPAAGDPGLLFAGHLGGGLDRRLSGHWSLRVVEAGYFATTYRNGVNDHQNNLRIGGGVVYRFGGHWQ
jgi:peptidoglycan-associated lipoprotein